MQEPTRRADGLCALHECRKPLPQVTEVMRRYARNQIERDPFCSSRCCRTYYGCPAPTGPAGGRPPQKIPTGGIHAK